MGLFSERDSSPAAGADSGRLQDAAASLNIGVPALLSPMSRGLVAAMIGADSIGVVVNVAAALTSSLEFTTRRRDFLQNPFSAEARSFAEAASGVELGRNAAALAIIVAATSVPGHQSLLTTFDLAAQVAIPETRLSSAIAPDLVTPDVSKNYSELLWSAGTDTDIAESWDPACAQAIHLKAAAIAISCGSISMMLDDWNRDPRGGATKFLSTVTNGATTVTEPADLIIHAPCVGLVLSRTDFCDVAAASTRNAETSLGFLFSGTSSAQQFDTTSLVCVTHRSPELNATLVHEREHVLGYILAGVKVPSIDVFAVTLAHPAVYMDSDAPIQVAREFCGLTGGAVRGELLAYTTEGFLQDRKPSDLVLDHLLLAIERLDDAHGSAAIDAHKHAIVKAISFLFDAAPTLMQNHRDDRHVMEHLSQNCGYRSIPELCALMRNLPVSGGSDAVRDFGLDTASRGALITKSFSENVRSLMEGRDATASDDDLAMAAIAMCHGQSTADLLARAAVTADPGLERAAIQAAAVAAVDFIGRGGASSLERVVGSFREQVDAAYGDDGAHIVSACERVLRLVGIFKRLYVPSESRVG